MRVGGAKGQGQGGNFDLGRHKIIGVGLSHRFRLSTEPSHGIKDAQGPGNLRQGRRAPGSRKRLPYPWHPNSTATLPTLLWVETSVSAGSRGSARTAGLYGLIAVRLLRQSAAYESPVRGLLDELKPPILPLGRRINATE